MNYYYVFLNIFQYVLLFVIVCFYLACLPPTCMFIDVKTPCRYVMIHDHHRSDRHTGTGTLPEKNVSSILSLNFHRQKNKTRFQPSGSSVAAPRAYGVLWLQVAGLTWSLLHRGRARQRTGGREEACSGGLSWFLESWTWQAL